MTKPINDLHPNMGEIFKGYSDLLAEVVNFGTHILSWDIDQANGGDEQLPVLLIFRNILEHLDAVSLLIRQSSVEPSKNLLRVMFESLLNLEYMLDNDCERRGLAFLVCGYHTELKFIEKISEDTAAHYQLKQKFKADKSMPSGLPSINIPGKREQEQRILKILALPLYREAEAEYQALLSAGKKNPSWYQLFGGPPNIDQLATKLNRQGLYELLYRTWSNTIHGQNVIKGNMTNGIDTGVAQIRNPRDAKQVTLHACNIALLLFQFFITKRLPQEKNKLSIWYKTVQPEISKLR